MASIAEIDKAVTAHGMWKVRLKSSIASGTSEIPVDKIKVDNQCAFGQWLYGSTLTAADTATANYKTVKALHAEFHKVAAKVAELALAGKKDEAEKVLATEFSDSSVKLSTAMMEWKKVSK